MHDGDEHIYRALAAVDGYFLDNRTGPIENPEEHRNKGNEQKRSLSIEATAHNNKILQRRIDATFSLGVYHTVGIGFEKSDDAVAIHGRAIPLRAYTQGLRACVGNGRVVLDSGLENLWSTLDNIILVKYSCTNFKPDQEHQQYRNERCLQEQEN